MTIQSARISGGNGERAENDYYATNPKAVEMLLKIHPLNIKTMLEPCVGEGHIADAIKNIYKDSISVDGIDIVDRGYPNTIVADFLTYKTDKKYDAIITNPPYSLATDFIEKGMSLLNESGNMAMFLKLHFLESSKRQKLFKKFPPKYIYVFRNRMSTWRYGKPKDDNGKNWVTTICHAWFIWEKGSNSEPIIRWI